MQPIYANQTASISELKRNPSALLKQANGQAIAILNHNQPSGYLVPADTFEQMIELMDDMALSTIVEERRKDLDKAVSVTLDELMSDDF